MYPHRNRSGIYIYFNNKIKIWTGDRWQQSPDGLKGHDPQYWMPLQFDSEGNLSNFTWLNSFEMDVATKIINK
jgi:hypothetical protein